MAFGKRKESRKNKNERNGVVEEIAHYDEDLEEEKAEARRPFSLVGNIIFLFTIAIIAVIGWFVWQTWVPQDLSTLPGYKQASSAIDIPKLLREADKKNATLTLSEADVNSYIASTLKASQQGVSSLFCKPSGVGIKFYDGYMEVIIERQLASSQMQTISLYVTVIQEEDPSSPIPITRLELRENKENMYPTLRGGKLGSMPVPQGYMILLTPSFEKIAQSYEDLLSSVFDNGRIIRISKGHIDLIPSRQSF